MQTSASPPHAVVGDPPSDSVLLALDPESTLDEATRPDEEPEDAAEAEGDETFHNLQGAVEALANFTSENVAGDRFEAANTAPGQR